MRSKNLRSRLVFITLLFLFLSNYPFLKIFSKPILVGGIPLLFLYLFALWAIFILLVFLIVKKTHDQ